MPIKKIIPLLSLALLPWFGTAQELPEGGEDTFTKEDVRRYREELKNRNLFFEANKAKITGSNEQALTLFEETVKADPSNDAAWYELAQLYFMKKDGPAALESARKAYDLQPSNTWYSITLASLYSNFGQPAEAQKIYKTLVQQHPENNEYALELANTFLQMDKPAEAVKIYDQLEQRLGISEELSMRKHRIYLATGKPKKALEELERLARENAWDSRILSMLAEFYLVQGKTNDALLTYNKIREIDPENPYINISLADFHRQQGNIEKATEYLKTGFANPYLDSDTKIQVMLSYYSQVKDYPGIEDDVTELTRIMSEVHPNEPRALMLRGEILMGQEEYREAAILFRKVNELDPGKYQVWENLLRIEALLDNYDSLAVESERAIALFPMQPMPYYFNGFASYMLKRYPEAIASLRKGVKLIASEPRLSADFYGMIGDANHAAGNDAEAFEAYESALKITPDYALVLNNYAYYLSLKGENLARAAEMARKAIAIEPANASYLDTYAWVLYKQGDYSGALEYIEKAMQVNTEASATLLEHYGDILYRLNRTGEARDAWQKAAEAGEGSELLGKKIKEGKLYE